MPGGVITGKSPAFLIGVAIATFVGFFAIARLLPILGASDQGVALRMVVQIAAAIGLLVVLTKALGVSPAPLGLQPFRFSALGWGLLCLLASFVLSATTLLIAGRFGYQQNPAVMAALAARPVWLLLLIAAGAGIAEEVVFRSVLLSHIEALTKNTYVGAGVSLAVFSLAHAAGWGFSQVIFAAMPGLALTLFFVWKRNLLVCIIAHFLTDAFGLLSAAMLLRHH